MEAEKKDEVQGGVVDAVAQAEHGKDVAGVGLLELTPEKSLWLKNLCAAEVANHTKNIQGKEYICIEGWQTLGAVLGCFAHCEEIKRITNEKTGELIGIEAHVSIVRSGQVLSRAVGFVSVDEMVWDKNKKEYVKKWKQESHMVGMAQTRGQSRAYSNVLRPVAVSLGYEGTTAEEMQGVEYVNQSERQPVQQNKISENEKKVLYDDLVKKRKEFVFVCNGYKDKYGDDDYLKDLREKYKQKENNTSAKWLVETIANVRSKISDFDTKKKAMPMPPSKDDPPLQAPESIKSDGKKPTTKAETKEVESFADDGKPTGTPKWLDDNGEGDPFLENEGMDTDEFMKNFDGEKGMKENAKAT